MTDPTTAILDLVRERGPQRLYSYEVRSTVANSCRDSDDEHAVVPAAIEDGALREVEWRETCGRCNGHGVPGHIGYGVSRLLCPSGCEQGTVPVTLLAAVCECECGGLVNPGRRFINGHNKRLSPLESRNEDRGYLTPCRVWLRAKANGYGRQWVAGRMVPAHRHAYEQAHGLVPPGLVLDHLCRQPDCVRVDHLEAVTHPENCRRGEGAKLTMAGADAIRAAEGTQREIAARFGVPRSTVSDIKNGKMWSE